MVKAMSIFILPNHYFMQKSETAKGDKRSANLFVLNMIIIYLLWKAFAYFVKHNTGAAHETWNKIIQFLGVIYATVTSAVLNAFGETTVQTGIGVLFPVENKIVYVEDHCLAIPATVIFIGSILSFTGQWQNKLWFIPMGIVLIILINLTRLVLLCYTFAHFPKPFYDINHSLVYVIITYSLIFLLIVWWMKRFSGLQGNRVG